MNKFDLIVIGGGPGGYLAAQRASENGLKTVLFEKDRLGGTCLNEGCIPTKTLLNSAKIYEHARDGGKFGVFTDDIRLEHEQVLERKDRVVKTLVSGVRMTMKRKKVTVISEQAYILGKTEEGFEVQAGDVSYTAEKLVLATGSEALIPPIPGIQEALDSGLAVTSREMLEQKEVPGRLVIVGAGVVGLEMASYFTALGVDVYVVEMMDKIAGRTDMEISVLLQKALESKGVHFLLGCAVRRITENGICYEKDGKEELLAADKILLSIGRKPRVKSVGIENIGLHAEQGRIVTDSRMRTSVEGVYAVGDVNGQVMLAHTAYREAEAAIHHMTGIEDAMDYTKIPSVIYTNPEAACVGETEESAGEKGIQVVTAKLPLAYAGRFVAENENVTGICKLIMEQDTRRLIGVHIAGTYASEMIWGAAGMMEQKVTVDDMKKIIFPHPTVSEIIKETLAVL